MYERHRGDDRVVNEVTEWSKQMNIENIAIKDIKPYERNAKKHDETQIKNVMESIKQFGFAQPLVVDKDNVLIIGHCRLIAAKRLKLKEVPVVRMDELTQEQVDKLRLLDNKLNESEWDFDLLAEDVPTLDFSDFDIDWDLPEDIEENTEIEKDISLSLEEKELSQYQYIHYLVTIKTGDESKYQEIIEHLKEMGAEVKETKNNT